MIPIVLDPSRMELALAGRGPALLSRLGWLSAGGAERLTVFSDQPLPGEALHVPHLPTARDLEGLDLLWITGLPPAEALPLSRLARAAGALVNVEDVTAMCDFHTPALVRRGDLVVAVSTAGRSPGLAARLRRWLDEQLPRDWSGRLELLARHRDEWRREGKALPELAALTDATIDRHGWLEAPGEPRRAA